LTCLPQPSSGCSCPFAIIRNPLTAAKTPGTVPGSGHLFPVAIHPIEVNVNEISIAGPIHPHPQLSLDDSNRKGRSNMLRKVKLDERAFQGITAQRHLRICSIHCIRPPALQMCILYTGVGQVRRHPLLKPDLPRGLRSWSDRRCICPRGCVGRCVGRRACGRRRACRSRCISRRNRRCFPTDRHIAIRRTTQHRSTLVGHIRLPWQLHAEHNRRAPPSRPPQRLETNRRQNKRPTRQVTK